MKKLFILFISLFALVACSELLIEEPVAPDKGQGNQKFKVALNITRSNVFDEFPDTRAAVKSGWADGDVVFLFINGVAAPKYLEMEYNDGEWESTPMNGLVASDLGASGTLTAVHFPNAKHATVAYQGGEFVFLGLGMPYNGVFLKATQVRYIFEDGLLGDVNMEAPALTGSDKYIHFDVSGYDSNHFYTLFQDNVKPVVFNGVSASGELNYSIGSAGKAIVGYFDEADSFLGFSGVLDGSAVGTAVNYDFSINDENACVLYTRNVGTKTVSASKYIGIGDISGSAWIATEYVNLGIKNDAGESLMYAKCNLGASSETGWGDYFIWGVPQPRQGVAWSSYPLCNGSRDALTKYCTVSSRGYQGFTDGKTILEPEDDAATQILRGLWRTPTKDELISLQRSCSSSWVENYKSSGVNGYRYFSNSNGETVFLPAAGNSTVNFPVGFRNERCFYWSSEVYDSYPYQAFHLFVLGSSYSVGIYDRNNGCTIRPVFSVELVSGANPAVGELESRGYVYMGNGLRWARVNLGAESPLETGDYFAWGELDTYYSSLSPLTWKSGKSGYDWYSYFDTDGSGSAFMEKYTLSSGLTVLLPEDDIAHRRWGGSWRMPTKADFEILTDRTQYDWVWDSVNLGYEVTCKANGNKMFLPGNGGTFVQNSIQNSTSMASYWSSSLDTSNQQRAYYMTCPDPSVFPNMQQISTANRYQGMFVRPVASIE